MQYAFGYHTQCIVICRLKTLMVLTTYVKVTHAQQQ